MRFLTLLMVVFLGAAPAFAKPAACAEQAKATAVFVHDVIADAMTAVSAATLVDVQLPAAENLTRARRPLVPDIVINEKGRAMAWGKPLEDGDLKRGLGRALNVVEQSKRNFGAASLAPMSATKRPLMLAVHPDAPWSKVVAILDARPTRFDSRVRWLFQLPPRTKEPKATWVRPTIAGKGFEERLKGVEAASAKISATCPSYQALLVQMSKARSTEKFRVFESGLEASLVQCRCRIELPALKDLLFVTLYRAPMGYVETLVPYSRKGTVLSAPGSKRFDDVAPQILRAAVQGPALVLLAPER